MPDAAIPAHAHNYLRCTLLITFNKKKRPIPFIVCGAGGRGITTVAKADGKSNGDHVCNKPLMD